MTDTEFDAAVEWVLDHPQRELVFPRWSNYQIQAAYGFCRKTYDAALFFFAEQPDNTHENQRNQGQHPHQDAPTGSILCAIRPDISQIYVIGVLGSIDTIERAYQSWAARYPTYRVAANRAGKLHEYSLSRLCRRFSHSRRG